MSEGGNPYSAPKARVASRDPGPGSPYKAVAIGLAVDVGGSTVAGVALSLLYSIVLGAMGTSAAEITELVDLIKSLRGVDGVLEVERTGRAG